MSDVHRTDLPVTFLQDIPPPHPGEGPSTQQHDHVPPMIAAFPFIPPFAPAAHTTFSSAPSGEPFMWSSPNVMPFSDPGAGEDPASSPLSLTISIRDTTSSSQTAPSF
ncbi:hypothetical protein Hanom_Chr14g01257711 [Helianthus anomalus]